jgi:hypothetical protein
MSDRELSKCSAAFDVRLALGNALPVEIGHLLDQVMIVQQDRAIGTYRERYSSLGTGTPASVGYASEATYAVAPGTS